MKQGTCARAALHVNEICSHLSIESSDGQKFHASGMKLLGLYLALEEIVSIHACTWKWKPTHHLLAHFWTNLCPALQSTGRNLMAAQ